MAMVVAVVGADWLEDFQAVMNSKDPEIEWPWAFSAWVVRQEDAEAIEAIACRGWRAFGPGEADDEKASNGKVKKPVSGD